MKKILFNGTSDNIFTFSIHITGRCNCACTYCHYYGQRNKKSVWEDLDENLYYLYLQFIKYWSERVEGKTIVRFSGGDPIVLGEKLFERINQAYLATGIRPYILTKAKGIDKDWIKRAKHSYLSHIFVSLENPLNSDSGAPDSYTIMKNISRLNSEELPILPGVMIIKNEDYKNLFKSCRIVYGYLGAIPTFSEMNFQVYRSPTKEELDDLYENVYWIVSEYSKKYPINIFPYVAPELGYGTTHPYIVDLNLSNTLKIQKGRFEEAVNSVITQLSQSYRKGDCKNYSCDWSRQCKIIKWLWYESYGRMTVEKKMTDYCQYKKVIMSAFYHVLTEQPRSNWDEGPSYSPREESDTPKDLILHGRQVNTEYNWEKIGVPVY